MLWIASRFFKKPLAMTEIFQKIHANFSLNFTPNLQNSKTINSKKPQILRKKFTQKKFKDKI